jgi:hypothetical protein
VPFSYAQYTGNGSTTTFSVPFPYLLRAHVKLYYGLNLVSGGYDTLLVDGSNYSWTSATQVQITPAPPNGTVLTIRRETPTTSRLVDWSDGSNLNAADLDTADLQNFYAIQEHRDYIDALTITPSANVTDGSITANKLSTDAVTTAKIANGAVTNDKITAFSIDANSKLAPGSIGTINIANNAIISQHISSLQVTEAKIANGAVTNAKVASNAAIAGTKIVPNFGSQNIVTSGTANLAGLAYPTVDGTAGQVISTDGSGVFGFANPGKVIKVQHYTDAGGTTTSSSLVDANTAAFSFTPLSASSTLILQFSFQAQQVAVAAVNVATSHRIHEGATGLGSTYNHGAASGSGGLALTSIAFIQVSIASTGTSARSFTLRHATNNASGPAGSTLINATIMEVAS